MLGRNNKNSGFTLIELMVAVAIFGVVMLIILESFLKVIAYNRTAAQNQGLQDHTEFIFQLMSREIRTAKADYGSCPDVVDGQIYTVADGALNFQNADGECVKYFLTDGRIKVDRLANGKTRSAMITPVDITVEKFIVHATDVYNPNEPDRHHPATVNYYIKLKSAIWDPNEIEFTNFITARNAGQF